ncbi:hypothetical protein D3C75_679220 [compost metagenome]
MPRFERRHAGTVHWLQIERCNAVTFLYLPDNSERFEEVPAVFLLTGFLVHIRFNTDEGIGNDAIGFCPGLQDVIRCCVAKHFLDGFQQKLTDNRILLRFNAKADMLVGNLDNRRQNILQVVNVNCCCIHCIRECCLLPALRLVGMIKHIKKFRMGRKQILIEHRCNGCAVFC